MFQDRIAIDIGTVPVEGLCGRVRTNTWYVGKRGVPDNSRDFSGLI